MLLAQIIFALQILLDWNSHKVYATFPVNINLIKKTTTTTTTTTTTEAPIDSGVTECFGTLINGTTLFNSVGYPADNHRSGICVLTVQAPPGSCSLSLEIIDFPYPEDFFDYDCDFISFRVNGPGVELGGYPFCGHFEGLTFLSSIQNPNNPEEIYVQVTYNPVFRFSIKATVINCSDLPTAEDLDGCGVNTISGRSNKVKNKIKSRPSKKNHFERREDRDKIKKSKGKPVSLEMINDYNNKTSPLKMHLIIPGEDEDKGDDKIYNGENADKGEFPWMVGVDYLYYTTPYRICGGSLVSSSWVVTAARCVYPFIFFNVDLEYLKVIMGDYRLYKQTDGIYRDISKLVFHSQYDNYMLNNDIAMVQLSSPIEFSDMIQPICLPFPKYSYDLKDADLTVIGWGTKKNYYTANVLQKATLSFVNHNRCNRKYEEDYIYPQRPGFPGISNTQICAGEGKTSIFWEDEGGPMTIESKKGPNVLIGIGSFFNIYSSSLPSVFSSASHFHTWILSAMQ